MADNLRAQYAKSILQQHHQLLRQPTDDSNTQRTLPKPLQPVCRAPEDPVKVGIIGAGGAGLYAALIIDSLKDARITYDIFDADPMEGRKGGGRLYTHNFPGGGVNDYFDIGAMRFPDIPFMKPVFDLLLKNPNSPIAGMLTINNYVLENPKNFKFYNGIIKTDAELGGKCPPLDPFNTGVNPPTTVSKMMDASIGVFTEKLKEPPFSAGWEYLMGFDEFSTRGYLQLADPKYSTTLVNYMETFDTGTNLFDQALAESVLESLDFAYSDNIKWICIQGGAGQIADAMISKMSQKVEYGKRVTALATTMNGNHADCVEVTVANELNTRKYSHAITTMPFSCLRLVDTTKCGFNWNLQTAIRALHYDSSVKVAIRFSRRWWEDPKLPGGPHYGGVSSTDRPTRVVVYPSYGIKQNTGATMIVSYTWSQDALRIGALAQGPDSEAETLLLESIVKDLAEMHQVKYESLWKMKLDHKVYDWYSSEYAAGAYAIFGPGQFSNLYQEVTKPVGGILHFAGEAASVHHGWLVGAFISAYRTVHEILFHQGFHDLIEKMEEIWGQPAELDTGLLKQQVALGQHPEFELQK